MKKIVVLIALTCIPFLGTSQSIFDKFEDSDRIGSITINKGMLDIVSKIMENDSDPESREFIEIANRINKIKIFLSEDEDAAEDMAVTMKQYVKSAKLEELMKVRDGDTNLNFYVRYGKDEDHVKELLMFAKGIDEKRKHDSYFEPETVLLTITGDIDLAQVGTLTKKMKLHKGLHKLDKE